MTFVSAKQGETLELMVFDHYGRQDGRLVERVLDHKQNRTIADAGEVLSLGQKVFMPDIKPLRPAAETRLIINPWD